MNIAVIGAGGHSKVIQDMILAQKGLRIAALLDDKFEQLSISGELLTGPVSAFHTVMEEVRDLKSVIAIGNNRVRRSIVSRLSLPDDHYVTLIHETAVVSPRAVIGCGTVVMPGAVVNADVILGRHSIVNTGAVVEHDSVVGEYAHIAPKATLTGAVQVERGAMIGAGAVVIPGKCVGEWAVVGAGATVISHIPSGSTAVGTPARIIKTVPIQEEADAYAGPFIS